MKKLILITGILLSTSLWAKNCLSPDDRMVYYVVYPGESLYRISQKLGVTIGDLVDGNNLSTSQLRTGQKLIVCKSWAKGNTKTVKKENDNLKQKEDKTDTRARINSVQNMPRPDLEYALLTTEMTLELTKENYAKAEEEIQRAKEVIQSADELIKILQERVVELENREMELSKDLKTLIQLGSQMNQSNKWLEFSNRVFKDTSTNQKIKPFSSTNDYSVILTVKNGDSCPITESPFMKQEMVRGNRICYYK